MDLKSGTLFWPDQNDAMLRHPSLKSDINCDVAIIGAGLTGALIARSLIGAGRDVVLIDKRDVGQGSTSASTALILYEIDTPLSELIRMIGRKKAERSYRICCDAISAIEQVITAMKDDCGFIRCRSLYLASARGHIRRLKNECRARARAGLKVQYFSTEELRNSFDLAGHGAILSSQAAVIDPYRFCNRLVESASAEGLRVFGRTETTHLESRNTRVILQAGRNQIKARKVVVAAGYESGYYLKKIAIRLKSTYAIATEPLNNWPHSDLVMWETARPYTYLRSTADGRLLAGGEDEDFRDPKRRDRLIPAKTRRLESKLAKLFPGIHMQTAYAWAGTFGETKDGLPYLGTIRGEPHVMYALCYGANGTNFAMIAANMIRDWVGGKPNRDRSLFSLDR